jgi:hypothetical protein
MFSPSSSVSASGLLSGIDPDILSRLNLLDMRRCYITRSADAGPLQPWIDAQGKLKFVCADAFRRICQRVRDPTRAECAAALRNRVFLEAIWCGLQAERFEVPSTATSKLFRDLGVEAARTRAYLGLLAQQCAGVGGGAGTNDAGCDGDGGFQAFAHGVESAREDHVRTWLGGLARVPLPPASLVLTRKRKRGA